MPGKKLLLLFVFLSPTIGSLILPNRVLAQISPCTTKGPWYNQTPCQFAERIGKKTPENEIFGERYTFAQVNWIINSLHAMLTPDFDNTELLDLIKKLTSPTGYAPTLREYASLGPVGLLTGGISEIYSNPPASGVDYARSSLAGLNLVQPVYAQGGGQGYQSLSAVQKVWAASRNMAFFLVTVFLIAAGFMIMFRVKINPQTAVTLQLMVPKLAITTLLIFFSYAISGLVLDLIYVIISFVLAMLQLNGVINPPGLQSAITFFTAPNYGNVVVYFLLPWILLTVFGGLVMLTAPITGGLGGFFGGFITIFGLIITIFLIWTLVKIWWMLLKTYLTLIFLIVIGPWQILLDLIPGQQGFGPWFRNVLAHASVFIVVPLMFIFNVIFWKPGFLNNFLSWLGFNGLKPLGDISTGVANAALPGLPLLGTGGEFFTFFIGYAILSLTPKMAEAIRDALKVPTFKYGVAFGEALEPVTKPVGGYLSSLGSGMSKTATTWVEHAGGGTLQAIGSGISNLRS